MLDEARIRALAKNVTQLLPSAAGATIPEHDLHALKALLNDLVDIADAQKITFPHRAAACNLLSTLLEGCASNDLEQVQRLIWSDGIWSRCFEIYLQRANNSKPKPFRQLLSALEKTLSQSQRLEQAAFVKQQVLERMLDVVTDHTQQPEAKALLQAFTHFLRKHCLTAHDVQSAYYRKKGIQASTSLFPFRAYILRDVIRWSLHADIASTAALLVFTVNETIHDAAVRTGEVIANDFEGSHAWIEPALHLLFEEPSAVESFERHALPVLLQDSYQVFERFLEASGIHSVLATNDKKLSKSDESAAHDQVDEALVLHTIMLGSKLAFVEVSSQVNRCVFGASILAIPSQCVVALLSSHSERARIAGLSVLIHAKTTTQPLSGCSIRLLQHFMPVFHADTDANFRGELHSLTQRLFERLRAAISTMSKPAAVLDGDAVRSHQQTPKRHGRTQLQTHVDFIDWFVTFIRSELRTGTTYQRHVCALKALNIVLRSGIEPSVSPKHLARSIQAKASWPLQIRILTAGLRRLLIDLLIDPFDDVRSMASTLLSLSSSERVVYDSNVEGATKEDTLLFKRSIVSALTHAEQLSSASGRADQADGVAHMYRLVFDIASHSIESDVSLWSSKLSIFEHLVAQLESTSRLLRTDVASAMSAKPLHGILISLRYILDGSGFYTSIPEDTSFQWKIMHRRIIEALRGVWEAVHSVLCNDAPEGFVPEDLDDESDAQIVKDALSYSWRALKEASALIRVLASSCPVGDISTSMMSREQLADLGDLCLRQLIELRHRGAFSTVAQTFLACCVRCLSPSLSMDSTVDTWYLESLACIRNKATINTRRSAGIPALLVGILAADNTNHARFSRALADLTEEATKSVPSQNSQTASLSQVHALNCLKDIFKNSRLGEMSQNHITSVLELSGNCLSSDIWSIRNSGLMLFRALLDRIFGTNDSYVDEEDSAPSGRRVYDLTRLMDIILRLLRAPSLELETDSRAIEGVFPALQLLQRVSIPEQSCAEVRIAIARLMSSPHWHVRDKAARTFAAIVEPDSAFEELRDLLGTNSNRQNALHGSLLGARYLARRILRGDPTSGADLMTVIDKSASQLYFENGCPFTKAAFIELYVVVLESAALRYLHAPLQSENHKPDTTTSILGNFSACKELGNLLQGHSARGQGDSLLHKALARASIYEIALCEDGSDQARKHRLLTDLATSDSEACISALEEIHSLQTKFVKDCRTLSDVFLDVCIELLDRPHVKTNVHNVARSTLLHLLRPTQLYGVQEKASERLMSLPTIQTGSSPLANDQALMLTGVILEAKLTYGTCLDHDTVQDFARWTMQLSLASGEDQPLDTRMAAATATSSMEKALVQLDTAAQSSTDVANTLMTFYIIVYDLLADDDEDVRLVATRTAAKVIRQAGSGGAKAGLLPPVAGSRLLAYLTKQFRNSTVPMSISVNRLMSEVASSRPTLSVKDSLQRVLNQGSALFVEERQNLFIDPSREARVWSQVLSRLSTFALPPDLAHDLTHWTMDGLDALREKAEAETDGPLGWSSKRDVFVLGLRCIFAAETILTWRSKTKKVPVPASEIRRALLRLLQAGEKGQLNVLWMDQVKRIIGNSLVDRCRRMSRALGPIDRSLGR